MVALPLAPPEFARFLLASAFLILAAAFLWQLWRTRTAGLNSARIALFVLFLLIGFSNALGYFLAQFLKATSVRHLVDEVNGVVGWPVVEVSSVVSILTIVPAVALILLARRYDLVVGGPHALVEVRDRLKVRKERMEALQAITLEATQSLDRRELAQRVARRLVTALGLDVAVVLAREVDVLTFLGSAGLDDAQEGTLREVDATRAPILWGALRGQATEAHTDTPQGALADAGIASVIVTPIRARGRFIGVLAAGSRTHRPFLPEEIELLDSVGNAMGAPLENAQLYHEALEARQRSEFLMDMISHDLRNYNMAAYGLLELAGEEGKVSPEAREYLAGAMGSIRDGNELMDHVRNLAKISHRTAVNLEPHDLNQAIGRTVRLAMEIFPEKDLHLDWEPNGQNPQVMADEFLDELLVNLLTNAIKYTPRERVEVRITAEPRHEAGREYWELAVEDHGIGIPDARKGEIFERLSRGAKGFGLGLSIVKAIADRYRGRVWVEDRVPGVPGKGSVFKVLLPRAT